MSDVDSRLQLAIDARWIGTWTYDIAAQTFSASSLFGALHGRSTGRLSYAEILASIHPEDRDAFAAALSATVLSGCDLSLSYRILLPDEPARRTSIIGQRRDAGAGSGCVSGVIRDDAAVSAVERDLEQHAALQRLVLAHSRVPIAILDEQARIVDANPALWRIVGIDPTRPACSLFDLIHDDDLDRIAERWVEIAADRPITIRARVRRHDRTWQQIEWTVAVAIFEHTHRFVLVSSDGDGYLAEDRRIQPMRYDPLTGLPARALLLERLTRALERSRLEPEYRFAVLYIDVDRFKHVNDRLGQTIGDQLLRTIANRLIGCLRPADTIARPGGDEFVVLLNPIDDTAHVREIAATIHERCAQPFRVQQFDVMTSVSIGIVVSDVGYREPEELLRDADTALRRAKRRGKACSEVFDRAMQLEIQKLAQIESDLRSALWHDVLQLHYQPIVALTSGRIVGVEALLRWFQPGRGYVSPAEFIPVAEETGLIMRIGEWVVQTAIAQAQCWQAAGFPVLYTAVNISALQFQQGEIADWIRGLLEKAGLDPGRFKLELTESSLIENAQTIIPELSLLQRLGVEIAMDDFGTGYSSLSYLKRLPLTTLKIDRSFVRDMTMDLQSSAIVKATIALAHSLNLSVIAEGVETSDQLALLQKFGCDAVQGFLLSRPVPAESITRLLEHDQPLIAPSVIDSGV